MVGELASEQATVGHRGDEQGPGGEGQQRRRRQVEHRDHTGEGGHAEPQGEPADDRATTNQVAVERNRWPRPAPRGVMVESIDSPHGDQVERICCRDGDDERDQHEGQLHPAR